MLLLCARWYQGPLLYVMLIQQVMDEFIFFFQHTDTDLFNSEWLVCSLKQGETAYKTYYMRYVFGMACLYLFITERIVWIAICSRVMFWKNFGPCIEFMLVLVFIKLFWRFLMILWSKLVLQVPFLNFGQFKFYFSTANLLNLGKLDKGQERTTLLGYDSLVSSAVHINVNGSNS